MDAKVLFNRPSGAPALRTPQTGSSTPSQNPGFDLFFRQALQKPSSEGLHISAHAEKRLSERNIPFDGQTGKMLQQAMDELRAKGARDSLILTKDGAFLVNIPSRTLITAMDPTEMQDRIITQVDSVSLKSI